MPELTPAEIIECRDHSHTLSKQYLWVHCPRTVFAAQVNGGGVDPGYAVQHIPFDNVTVGVIGDVLRGHTVWIGSAPGLKDGGIIRVHSDGAGATIDVSEHEIYLYDDVYITVKEDYRLWHVSPFLDVTGPTWYKDCDDITAPAAIAFPGNDDDIYQPVPVMGPHSIEFLEADVATHNFDWSRSWTISPNSGALTYAATFPGGTPPNSAAANGTIVWNTAGERWVTLSLTDDMGANPAVVAYNAHRLYVTLDRDNLPDNVYVAFRPGPRQGTVAQGGFTMQFTVFVDAPEEDFPDEALVIWFFDSGTQDDIGGNWAHRTHIKFIGYITKASTHKEPETGAVTFEATTIQGLLQATPIFPNFVEIDATPSVWTEAHGLTVQRAAYLHMRWMSSLLEVADVLFVPDADTSIGEHEFPEGTLYSQLNSLINRDYMYRIGCDPLSTIYFNKDPQFLNRPGAYLPPVGIDTIMTIEAEDWRGEIDLPEPLVPSTGYVLASGNSYFGGTVNPWFSNAPGPVPLARGKRDRSLSRLICLSQAAPAPQTRLNVISGLALAQANNDFPDIPVKMDGQYYIGHLFPMEFVELDIQGLPLPGGSEEGTKRDVDLSSDKFIPRRSSLQVVYDEHGGVSHGLVDINVEKLTYGVAGRTLLYPTGVGPGPDGIDPPGPGDGPDGGGWLPIPTAWPAVAGGDGSSGVYWTPDSGQTWEDRSPLDGLGDPLDVLDLIWDPWWKTASRANTSDPNHVILWACGEGFIVMSGQDAGLTWTDITPATPADDPPNTWGDVTPPRADTVTYKQLHADMHNLKMVYALVEWQEVDSGNDEWRGWIAKTTDDGASWTWYETPGAASALPAFWKLDEATGAARLDCAGTNDLTNHGNVAQIGGMIGNASHFNASANQYLSINDTADLSLGPGVSMTVACWVYLDSKPGMYILQKFADIAPVAGYGLQYHAGPDRFVFHITLAGPATFSIRANTFGSPATGTWYFIVAWYDADAQEVGISVNNGAADTLAAPGAAVNTPASFFVGARVSFGPVMYWDGRIDALGFWKRVLTPADRAYMWNAGAGRETCADFGPAAQLRPLAMDLDTEDGTRLYVTFWEDGTLYAKNLDASDPEVENESVSFGAATLVQMEAKTYWIVPRTPYVPDDANFGDYVWIFGHYNDGADKHMAFSDDGGGSFDDRNDGAWGAAHRVGAIETIYDGLTLYVFMNHAATPNLWATVDQGVNWTNPNTVPFNVEFEAQYRFDAVGHGVGSEPDLLLVGSNAAGAQMAAYLAAPYTGAWVDATGSPSLPITGPVSAIIWI